MRQLNVNIVLVALLLAAITMVPMVSADEPYNDAINASKEMKRILTRDESKNAPVHPPKIFDLHHWQK